MNLPNKPLKVAVLALPAGILTTLAGPLDVLSFCGHAWNTFLGRKPIPCFQVRLISPDGQAVTTRNGISLAVQGDLAEAGLADIIFLTSGGEDPLRMLVRHPQLPAWLRARHSQGAVIAAVCSGVFILAESGLLDGLEATTHWGLAASFRKRYPKVKLQPESLLIDQGRLLTAGGVHAGSDLALHLVQRYYGKTVAQQCAAALLLEDPRHNQARFAPLLHLRQHGDGDIEACQDWLEDRFTEPLNLDQLAVRCHMSARTFHRRFKRATGETPRAYIQKLRMWAARDLMRQCVLTMDEVAHRVGYEDVPFFRVLFKRQFGMSPAAFQLRLQGESH